MMNVPLVLKMSPGGSFQKNLRWLLFKQIQIITESVKTEQSRVSWKMFQMEFKFSKLSLIRSKALCLEISELTKRQLRVQRRLCVTDNVNRHRSKKIKKTICVKQICKILEICGLTFLPTNDFSLLESCQLKIIANYKASNCFKTEAVIQRCAG